MLILKALQVTVDSGTLMEIIIYPFTDEESRAQKC